MVKEAEHCGGRIYSVSGTASIFHGGGTSGCDAGYTGSGHINVAKITIRIDPIVTFFISQTSSVFRCSTSFVLRVIAPFFGAPVEQGKASNAKQANHEIPASHSTSSLAYVFKTGHACWKTASIFVFIEPPALGGWFFVCFCFVPASQFEPSSLR